METDTTGISRKLDKALRPCATLAAASELGWATLADERNERHAIADVEEALAALVEAIEAREALRETTIASLGGVKAVMQAAARNKAAVRRFFREST